MKNPIALLFSSFGGRKSTLCIVAIVLVALRNVLGLDETAVQWIVWLALGGSGAIAIEDAAQKLRAKAK